MLGLTIKNAVRRMAPPTVKTPTPWPCVGAQVGEVLDCPGTRGNHLCNELVQIRAGTKPDKPSFGKMFIMHPTDDGGCGYFSYIKILAENPDEVLLEEPVYQRAKRKMAVSKVPEGDIDPTDGGSVAKKQKVEMTDRMQAHLFELEGRVLDLEKKVAQFTHTLHKMKYPESPPRPTSFTQDDQMEEGEIPACTPCDPKD